MTFSNNIVIRTATDATTIDAIRIGENAIIAHGYNNVIFNAGAKNVKGIRLPNSTVGNWKNNIVQGFTEGISHLSSGIVHDYNCYHDNNANYAGGMTAGPNDIAADPLLNDTGAEDFRIASGSPCIGAGVDAGITRDWNDTLLSSPFDIGAIKKAA